MRTFWRNALFAIWLPAQAALAAAPGAEGCIRTVGDNLLENPRFELDEHGRRFRWAAMQHAGTKAYRVSVENGVLTISKFDEQAWFVFGQALEIPDRIGQRLRFSAEIRLDMTEDPGHAFEQGGGLSLVIRGKPNKLLLRSILDHEPRLGKTGWEPVAVTVVVPPGAETLTANFLHQANGTLKVRKPELRQVEETCGGELPR